MAVYLSEFVVVFEVRARGFKPNINKTLLLVY